MTPNLCFPETCLMNVILTDIFWGVCVCVCGEGGRVYVQKNPKKNTFI